jgi:hypothetical protein
LAYQGICIGPRNGGPDVPQGVDLSRLDDQYRINTPAWMRSNKANEALARIIGVAKVEAIFFRMVSPLV